MTREMHGMISAQHQKLLALRADDPQFAVAAVEGVMKMAGWANASDIHWQPRENVWEVSLRVDGVLQTLVTLPRSRDTDPVARLKVLSGLLTYQTTIPQEGRLQGASNGYEARVSTFPTVYGERAVVRLLPQRQRFDRLDDLGLSPQILEELRELFTERDGAILVAGSAGSGKTTTIYAALREIAQGSVQRSVVTVEDPVEAIVAGISQSSIENSVGFSFPVALRSVLRQDPEVLMIGEVRDPESAEIALRAALTGHLVLTTLHASDSATALRRLQELGLPSYLIRSGLRAVLCQRLIRRLCTVCRRESDIDTQEYKLHQAWNATGCQECLGTGYGGRIAVAELLRLDRGPVAHAIGVAFDSHATASEIYTSAQTAGLRSMVSTARQLVEGGVTSIAELYRSFGAQVHFELLKESRLE